MAKKLASAPVESDFLNPKSPLLRATDALDKVLGTNRWRANLDNESFSDAMPHIPTGSVAIDYLLGGSPNKFGVRICPGIPKSRITQVYGTESSGKTTLALTLCAAVNRAGGSAVFIDYENAISVSYAAGLGVMVKDRSMFLLAQPDTLEDGFKVIIAAASAGVDLIVIDSIGAAIPRAAAEVALEDLGKTRQVGLLASKWSEFLPLMRDRLRKTGSAVLAIAQIRDAINTMGHGDSTNVQGGRAWKFYPDIRLKLARIKQESGKVYNTITHKVEDQMASGVIKIKVEKCKVSDAQGKESLFYIRYGAGIDDERSFLEIAMAHGLIKKAGSWYSWEMPDGTEVRGQGLDKIVKEIHKLGAMPQLKAMVIPLLQSEKVDTTNVDDDEGEGGVDDEDLFAGYTEA